MDTPKYVGRAVRASRRACVYALVNAMEGHFFRNYNGPQPFPVGELNWFLNYINHADKTEIEYLNSLYNNEDS